jgi:acetoin utilization deacetylase AcuC-like enzyme
LVTADLFADHTTPPGHPERPERAEAMQVVDARWTRSGGQILAPRAATDDELARVHRPEYIELMQATRGHATMLDPDTFTSPETEEIARVAAGAVLVGVEHVLAGASNRRAFVMVRPPGHHAEADKAMGFCFYNNVAIGAAAARASGVDRVAIVDYDVHHGNGTQATLYADPSVLFIYSHQYPFYPGTGGAAEIGVAEGTGYTVNFPLEAGATNADFDLVYREAVIPVLEQYQPQLVLVSAGFDAHERDPLGGMQMTTDGFAQLSARLIAAADTLCEGRIVFVTEGGYDTSALAECCQAVIDRAAANVRAHMTVSSDETRRGDDTLRQFRTAHHRERPATR